MGGKKKTMANKMSKMSDEERARYLQHRAEIEEEAKKRKQQLIATFMKKKIKKEDAFSRLNISKINQNWHQLLRKLKVKEMKDEVEHLKKYIGRVVDYKNRRISKLMEELEEAEEQYLNNFNSHSKHVDNTIESQNEYINKLQSQYQEELDALLDQAEKEENSVVNRANSEVAYLKTVIFGQETKATKELRDSWEYYSIQLYEIKNYNSTRLRHLRATRGETESALWRQMLQVVRLYVQRTDVRRSHLQELRRMDAESADEIRKNEERISQEEELIRTLNVRHEDLLQTRSDKIKFLETQEKRLKIKFIKVRKILKSDIALDEEQLRFLAAISNETLDKLSALLNQGGHLLHLSHTCQKFVTEREHILKWLPMIHIADITECDDLKEEEFICQEDKKIGDGLTDDEKLYQKALGQEFSLPKISEDIGTDTFTESENLRPKTAITSKFTKSAAPETTKFVPIEEVKIEVKKCTDTKGKESRSASSLSEQSSDGEKFLEKCYDNLKKLESFWVIYNKADIDVMELKKEKNVIKSENRQLRGIIRAVLEAAALAKRIPESRISTRVPSQRRSAYSAPLQRIVFN